MHSVPNDIIGGNPFKNSLNNSRRSIGHLADEELKEEGGRKSLNQSRLESSYREISLVYMAGTINKEDIIRFKRLLFRASRGKVLSYFEDMDMKLKDFQGDELNKVVFILVFEEGTHFREKVSTICDSFQGKRFHLPGDGHGDHSIFQRKAVQIE